MKNKSLEKISLRKSNLSLDIHNNSEDRTVRFDWQGVTYSEKTKNNLALCNINPLELKTILNETPSKFAYWSSMLSDVNLEISKLDRDYGFWHAKKYMEVYNSSKKRLTETQIKNLIMNKYPKSVNAYLVQKERLVWVKSKISSIVKAYDMSSKTLQSISSIMKSELAIFKS